VQVEPRHVFGRGGATTARRSKPRRRGVHLAPGRDEDDASPVFFLNEGVSGLALDCGLGRVVGLPRWAGPWAPVGLPRPGEPR
jgi:hypothetical protein